MKVLSKKEGGFYNNKLLMISVLMLIVIGLAWVVIAAFTASDIDLQGPENNTLDWDGTVNFTCKVAAGSGLTNMSLWTNLSGTWQLNRTDPGATQVNTVYNFTISGILDTSYAVWSCGANQSSVMSDTNWTIQIDATGPTAFNLNKNSTSYSNNNTVITGSVNTYVVLNWTNTTEAHFINYTVLVYNSTTYIGANLIAVNKTTSVSTTNVNVTPLAGGAFADDTYYWYVKAYENDSAGRVERNSTELPLAFIIDTGFTATTLNAPGNNTWDNDGSVLFNFTVNDNNPNNCTIYYNLSGSGFILNYTNTSLSQNDVVTYTIALGDGNYTWYVWCNDTSGNDANTSQYIVKVDNTDPVVGLNNPAHQTYDADGVVSFNFTTLEKYPETCVLWHNATGTYQSNQTVSYTNGTQIKFANTVTFPADGNYSWNVVCNDTAGNYVSNATNFTILVDAAVPLMTLIGPANNSYQSSTSVLFNYTANDTFLDTCILYGNFSGSWAANETDTGLADATLLELNQTLVLTTEKTYEWNALCNDTSGRSSWLNSAGNYSFIVSVDSTVPAVALNSPANNSNVSTTFTFSYTPTDINIGSCTLWGNFSGTYKANSTNSGEVNGTANSISLTNALSDTYYIWSVRCNDSAGNLGVSANYTFTADSTRPTVTLNLPINNTFDTDGSVTFNWTGTDADIDSCALWANFSGSYALNESNSSYVSGVYDITSKTLSNGFYVWNAVCNDTAGNLGSNSSNFTLTVDSTAPTISAVNKTTTSSRVVTFNVTDASITGVNLSRIAVADGVNTTVTGVFNSTRMCTSITNGYQCSYIENGLEAGGNVLKISAYDDAGGSTDYYLGITTSAARKFNLSLVGGQWNLISTPLILTNTSIDNIVANNSNITKIHYFNGSDWTSWYSTTGDTLTTVTPLNGYWVYASSTTTTQFFGNYTASGPSEPSLTKSLLANRWYTIGPFSASGTDNIDTEDALVSLCGGARCGLDTDPGFTLVYYWNATSGSYIDIMKGDADWTADDLWDRGTGFWLRTDEANTYT